MHSASTWASGNHKCTGIIGTLLAKAKKKENQRNFCSRLEKEKVNKLSQIALPTKSYTIISNHTAFY